VLSPTRQHGIVKAASFLAQQVSHVDSPEFTALVEAAWKASRSQDPDVLDKVKGMIRGMIAKTQQNLAESTDHKHFCISQTEESKKKLEEVSFRRDKAHADLDKMSAQYDEVKDQIGDTHADLAKLQKGIPKALAIREKEHDEYMAKKAQYEVPTPEFKPFQEETEEDRAKREDMEEKRLKSQIVLERKEADADFAFKRMSESTQESIDKKEKSAKSKDRDIVNRDVRLVEAKRDLSSMNQMLAAAKTYDEQVKAQCTVPQEAHKERAMRRDNEIDSLKNAYQILSGDAIPV